MMWTYAEVVDLAQTMLGCGVVIGAGLTVLAWFAVSRSKRDDADAISRRPFDRAKAGR